MRLSFLFQSLALTALAEGNGVAKSGGVRYEFPVPEKSKALPEQPRPQNDASHGRKMSPKHEEGSLRKLQQTNGNGYGNGNAHGNQDIFTHEYYDDDYNDDGPPPPLIGQEYDITPSDVGGIRGLKNCDNGNKSPECWSVDEKQNTATYTLTHRDATYMALHVNDYDLKNDCSVTISNEDGSEKVNIDSSGNGRQRLQNIWTTSVYGNTIKMTAKCPWYRKVEKDAHIEIDKYAAGYPDYTVASGRQLKICGVDDRKNAKCYSNGTNEVEYKTSKAVARLKFGGTVGCTGFLASSANRNFLMTNRHCLKSDDTSPEDRVQDADIEFMAEKFNCSADNCPNCGVQNPDYIVCRSGSASLVMDNFKWNYAVIEINDTTCVDKNGTATSRTLTELFGYIPVYSGPALVDEEIYIAQHPKNKAKEIAIYSDVDGGGRCKIRSVAEKGKCASKNADDALLGHGCDTEKTSAGSPVISPDHNHTAVALHTCGKNDCPGTNDTKLNKAVFFKDICEHMLGQGRTYLYSKICGGT